jgi:protease II
MNCPFHIAIYKDGYYSYRDLPLRFAELGTVYRWAGGRGGGYGGRNWLEAAHSSG